MSELPRTLESIAFALQHAPGIGGAGLRRVLTRIEREGIDASAFLALDAPQLRSRFGLPGAAVEALHEPASRTLQTWEKLQQRGIRITVMGQPDYPERVCTLLGESVPPILYWIGAETLFNVPAVGFCGSRKASAKGLDVARQCSRLLSTQGVTAVSGYAHGVDLAAHTAALEAGGSTTFVLAEGILHFRVKEPVRTLLDPEHLDRALVVSEFPPSLPWKAHNAMTRNRTICALSDAIIVIESGMEGGTFEAGKTALALNLPLFCVEYAEPAETAAGNPYLLQHGAISLRRSRGGEPNLTRLVQAVHEHPHRSNAQSEFSLAAGVSSKETP